MWTVFLLVFSSLHSSSLGQVRVRLVQHQVCGQEREEVVCRCGENNTTYLGIRMEGFLRQQNTAQVRLSALLTSYASHHAPLTPRMSDLLKFSQFSVKLFYLHHYTGPSGAS